MSESEQKSNINSPTPEPTLEPASAPTPAPEPETEPAPTSPSESDPLLSNTNLRLEIPTSSDVIAPSINSPIPEPLALSENIENIIPTQSKKKFFPDSDDELVSDVKTLAQYVTLILTVTDVENKYSLTIDSKLNSILTTLLSTGTYFDKIEQTFKEIVQDNKVDANDVPKIMILLVELYTTLKDSKVAFNKELCGEVLKTVFTVIVKEKLIPVTDKETELLRCIYDIVESSVQLAQMSDSDNKGGIFACLKKYFK